MANTLWQTIIDADYTLPTGHSVAALTPELLANLASSDPFLRDEVAYPILGTWIERGYYTPGELRAIAAQMLANLSSSLGEQNSDSVFLRTFSALILECVIEYDNAHPFLEESEIRRWLDAALNYLAAEKDLRGYVPIKGWAHSAAHTADLLMILAKNRYVGAPDLERILNAVAGKVIIPVAHVYIYIEDERLAYTVMAALRRNLLAMSFLAPWLQRFAQTRDGIPWKEAQAFTTESTASAYYNARSFLRSLYFQLSFAQNPPALASDLKLHIELILQIMDLGFYDYLD